MRDVSLRTLLSGVLFALLIAACGPLPRPFAPEDKQTGLMIPALLAARPVAVAPVGGVPGASGRALAEAVARDLREAGFPANAGQANPSGLLLSGRVLTGRDLPSEAAGAMRLRWDLRNGDGTALGGFAIEESAPRRKWGSPQSVSRLATRSVQPVLGVLRQAGIADPGTSDRPEDLPLALWSVSGAPGDGDRALAESMRDALARAGIRIIEERDAAPLLLLGSVYLEAPRQGLQHVEISWELIRPDGARLGTVTQANNVPAGSLEGTWGELAVTVAEAGAGGIIDLLGRVGPAALAAAPPAEGP